MVDGVGYRKPTVDRKDKVPEGYSPPECFMRLDKPPGIYEVLKTVLHSVCYLLHRFYPACRLLVVLISNFVDLT